MNSEFEKRLEQQPMRKVPADWRAEILRNAQAAGSLNSSPVTRQSLLVPLRQLVLSIRWHLAGISAAWLLIAVLNMDRPSPVMVTIAKANRSSSQELVKALQENRRQIVELVEPQNEEPVFTPPRRSQITTPDTINTTV